MEDGDVATAMAVTGDDDAVVVRSGTGRLGPSSVRTTSKRRSLASQIEEMTSDGAFLRAIEEKSPQIAICRAILHKRTGRRTLEDIHVLKSFFASSKLLEFFSNLDAYKLDRLYQSLELMDFPEKGAYVFHEGDDGDSFYLVYTGRVEVVQKDPESPARSTIHLAFLGPGDTFGERALLSNSDVRSASVMIASAPAELVFINRVVFAELLRESHDAATSSSTLEISKRFRSNKDIVRNIFLRNSTQRSEKDLKFAVEYLKSVKFFSRFSFEVRKQLCKVMRLISSVTNTVLFEEGQVGRHFYILFTGCVDVSVHVKNRFEEITENVVSRLGEGDYFGELALSQEDGVRRATVVCTDFCELLVLGRDQYEPLIKKYQNEYHAQYAQMLRKNSYFMGPEWDDNTIEGMCSVMSEKYIPFKGEICKQGSRAAELFIVTRGECRIVHEGKHPITNGRQLYELGRFGPNSVLGCAEASAGKFNDIFVRDYSIYAESPMKILVLSRFDIFHLMSAEARASLQRSSNGFIRESVQSRALKSVAWEKYKKTFLSNIMAERQQRHGQQFRSSVKLEAVSRTMPQGESVSLGKSLSAPQLQTRGIPQALVEPGSLILERRRGSSKTGGAPNVFRPGNTSPKAIRLVKAPSGLQDSSRSSGALFDSDKLHEMPATDENGQSKGRSYLLRKSADVDNASRENEREVQSAPSAMRFHRSSTTTALEILQGRGKLPVLDQDKLPGNDKDEITVPPDQQRRARSSSVVDEGRLSKRRSNPDTVGERTSVSKGPRTLALPAVSLVRSTAAEQLSSPGGFRSDLRRCGRVRTEKAESALNASKNGLAASTPINAATIWDPVHGVCQPFAVLGFMKERSVAPVSRATSSSSTSKPRTAKSVAEHLRKVAAAAASAAGGHMEFTRFRVFGKFCDVNAALDLFRRICAVERTAGISDNRDCSRFAVYKEDEMTMALENFPSSEEATSSPDAAPASGPAPPPTSEQFRASDLAHATGQRFACVSVLLQQNGSTGPATCMEAIVVHVYQCFPTPQSAVRFARQIASTLLAPGALCIVPLFEWISLAELERFDARNADLEQELEQAMRRGGRESYGSTWKARKEALKKGGGPHIHHQQASRQQQQQQQQQQTLGPVVV